MLIVQEPIVFRDDITIKIDGGGRGIHSRSERPRPMCDAEGNRNT